MSEYDSDSSSSSVSSSSYISTSVSLGIPDGLIALPTDLTDPQVSRLGGRPCFLNLHRYPKINETECKRCGERMELLLQIYAPLEGTVDDRVVYLFGCARQGCQGVAGESTRSVRAFTSIIRNEKYANATEGRIAKKKALKAAKEAAAKESEAKSINPFASGSSSTTFNPFSAPAISDSNPFGASSNPFASPAAPSLFGEVSAPAGTAIDESLSADLQKTSLETAPVVAAEETEDDDDDDVARELDRGAWNALQAYPAQYLNTEPEYAPPPKGYKKPTLDVSKSADKEAGGSGPKELIDDWGGYEKTGLPGVDPVFERFVQRVSWESEQVLRYDFGGAPLGYNSTSPLYKQLFKAQPSAAHLRKEFTPSLVPKCSRCGGPRVFELQAMPGLLHFLKPSTLNDFASETSSDVSDAQRRHELSLTLNKQSNPGSGETKKKTGMDWGCVSLFSCEKACGGDWGEEWVGVEWEE